VTRNNLPIIVILDVDGVFTDGKFIYSTEGKMLKVFGSWDSEALHKIKDKVELKFISADPTGFDISKKRVEDMGYDLQFVHSKERENLVQTLKSAYFVIFIADSHSDFLALAAADISFTPANAHKKAKEVSTFALESKGGEGAVDEMVELLLKSMLFARTL
jgi:YrbI family 3-deoxy-D-manno-octulosonate 8-phosphate phosphatase